MYDSILPAETICCPRLSTTGIGAPMKLNVASWTRVRALRSQVGAAVVEEGGPAKERASHPSPKRELGKKCCWRIVTRGMAALAPLRPAAWSVTRMAGCTAGSVRQHT